MKGWNIPRLSQDRLVWLANINHDQRVTLANALRPHATNYDQAYRVIDYYVEAAAMVLLTKYGKRTSGYYIDYDFPKDRLKERLNNINRALPGWAKWR